MTFLSSWYSSCEGFSTEIEMLQKPFQTSRRRTMAELVREITDDNFKEELAVDEPVLVDFWAPWCGPCRLIAPVVEEIARKYAGRLKVTKVNVDDNPLLASKFNIQGIPTLGFFKSGQLVDRVVGAAPQAQLESVIEGVL